MPLLQDELLVLTPHFLHQVLNALQQHRDVKLFCRVASLVVKLASRQIVLNLNFVQLSDEIGDVVLGPLRLQHF